MVAMEWPSTEQLIEFLQNNEISDGNSVLTMTPAGSQGTAVDADGFPRSNIAVYKLRQKTICLRRCRANLIEIVEQHLGKAHAKYLLCNKTGAFGSNHSAIYAYNYVGPDIDDLPTDDGSFASVGYVQEGSPAHLGGLRQNDKFLQFGNINSDNFTDVSQLQEMVKDCIGQPIDILVKRDEDIVNVVVVPKRWERNGLFGCQIIKQWCVVRVTT